MAASIDKSSIHKILIIQTAFLGDVILTTGLVRAAVHALPTAEIHVLAIPETSEIFERNPYVTRVLQFFKRNPKRKYHSLLKIIKEIRTQRYDAAISVQGSWTSSLMMLLGGIRLRIGFDNQKFMTDVVPLEKNLHATRRHLKLLTPLTDRQFDSTTELFWPESCEVKAKSLVSEVLGGECKRHPGLVGLAPGSIWETKRWPAEYFSRLPGLLPLSAYRFVLLGGEGDRYMCEKIAEAADTRIFNYAGELSLLESAALISKLDLLISNDSACMHIANAVRTDVFALFGPTVRNFGFFPYQPNDRLFEVDLYCRPCGKHGGRRCPEGHFRCMREITPEQVAAAVQEHLDL